MNLGAISHAREELKQAQEVFKEMQNKGLIAIDADEDPAMDVENVMKEESSMKIPVQVSNISQSPSRSLPNKQTKSMHVEEQEQQKKRPRKEETMVTPAEVPVGAAPTSAAAGLPSLQPFGTAHNG